jgi:hypothetical protein
VAGVIYLDIDDEITSAAARIRTAEGSRVAVVLPYGSRVATSRINFRLLARDALTNGKRLSIVAGDGATRALAASAGLPIFSTVGEYESSLEDGRPETAMTSAAGATGDDEPILVSETVATPPAKARGRRARTDAAAAGATAGAAAGAASPAATTAGSTTPAAAVTAAAAAAGAATMTGAAEMSPAPPAGEPKRAVRAPAAIPAARVVADTPALERDGPAVSRPGLAGRSFRPSIGRTPLIIGLAVLALALVVGGAAAYLYLPTATAVIAPREATIGPEPLRIVASTTATEPDPERRIVPAQLLTIEVEASDSFPATGKRIEETKAKGAVRFDNLDPTSSNTIPKGSVVSTGSGVRFRTDRAVTVAAAELVGLTIVPARATVRVTAVDAGPDGNVEPNTITTIPRGEEPFFLKVTNPDATTGGSRTEFPRIQQEDVDTAMAALTEQLTAAFDERLDDPDLPGDTATVFPETKAFGRPVFGVDPETLVGQEVETFELTASGSGTVVAVDTTPVRAVAEARIASSVDPGYTLIDGSGQVVPAPAEISNGVITFPVVVTARQVLVLDPNAIEREIMGKPLEQAREILATYGDAELTVWPEWVGTVPTIESRVEVMTSGAVELETPAPGSEAPP